MHGQIISECRKQENIISFFVGNSWQYLYILSQKFQPDKYGSTMDANEVFVVLAVCNADFPRLNFHWGVELIRHELFL